MCGIVGYVGDRKALPILINGLKRLEYRGYDSAGVALIEEDQLWSRKRKGKIRELEIEIDDADPQATVGIAHTRWATRAAYHGECPSSFWLQKAHCPGA